MSSSLSPHAAVTTRRQRPLSLSLSRSVHLLYNNATTTLIFLCPKSYLYIYDFSAYLHICPSNRFGTDRAQFCDEPVLCILHPVPSGGTCFPTNSPFTLAWNVIPIRSAFGMLAACWESEPWSTCLTSSRSCGSSSTRTLVLLLAPGSNDTSARYASSWSGRPRSSQGGSHFDCRNRVGIHHAGYRAPR